MTKSSKTTLFKHSAPRPVTALERISQAAKEIIDDETAERETKTARLRKARLERDASKPDCAAKSERKKS